MQQSTRTFVFMLVLGLFLYWSWHQQMDYQRRLAEWRKNNPDQVEVVGGGVTPAPVPAPATAEATAVSPPVGATSAAAPASLSALFAQAPSAAAEEHVVVTPDRMRLVFSSRGGRLVSARLLDYPEIFPQRRFLEIHLDHRAGAAAAHIRHLLALKAGQEERLELSPKGRRELSARDAGEVELLAETAVELVAEGERPLGLTLASGQTDASLDYAFSAGEMRITEDTALVLTAHVVGATITKSFALAPDSYKIQMAITIELGPSVSGLDEPMTLDWPGGVGRVFPEESSRYVRAVYRLDGGNEEITADSLAGAVRKRGGPVVHEGDVNFAGVDNRYFLAAFIAKDRSTGMRLEASRPIIAPEVVRPGVHFFLPFEGARPDSPAEQHLEVYLGPKDYDELEAAGGSVELGNTLYGGWTGAISIIMLRILNMFYWVWPNYGVAILLLTLLVKLATFPLMAKQMKTMKRMQTLQPLIKEIQGRNKDNPRQAQKEQFELMRKHKANPMAGCLPLIATMPIFIALWYTTQNTIGLRGEPFAFWIRDLAQPDTLFYLPFEVPFFGGLFDFNLLPLLSAIFMLWQMNKSNMDPKQKPMMIMMPLIMMPIFWRLPSGTNLYFMMSSVFQIFQQWYMNRTEDGIVVPSAGAADTTDDPTSRRDQPARVPQKSAGRTKNKK